LEQSLAANPNVMDQAELSKLQSQISELETKLLAAQRKGASPSYAVVPYVGPNETRRRPIYIECRRDRIVLQPEGVVLTERDFDGPMDNSNALASSVRAAEQYLGRNRQSNLRETGEPYPLLLVRPDGVNSYYVARAALRSWGADFGYELIDEDWQLDFKEPDASLASVEAKAVEDARERLQYLGYAGTGVGGGGAFSGRSRGGSGGFAQADEDDARGGRFRVSADGRVVREYGSASGAPRPRVGGSRLSRYSEITGDASQSASAAANGAASGSAAARGPRPSVAEWNDPPVIPPAAAGGLAEGLGSEQASTSAENGSHQGAYAPRSPTNAAATGDASAATTAGPSFPTSAGQPAAGSPGGSAMGAPASDAAVASDQQGPQILPQKLFGQNHAREGASSLAESQGKNWALPDSSRGSIPVTRPINVQCLEDRIVVMPEVPGGPGRRDLPFAGQTTNAVTGLITAIWDRMDGWGIAGKGMYWRPELHVQATPGGARRLAELKALLADSGIVIVEKAAARTARRY
jgi:hypothetical protein